MAENAAIEIDPELNIHSDQFNPLKALLSEEKLALDENAPVYDSISIFESRLNRTGTSPPLELRRPASSSRPTIAVPPSLQGPRDRATG